MLILIEETTLVSTLILIEETTLVSKICHDAEF